MKQSNGTVVRWLMMGAGCAALTLLGGCGVVTDGQMSWVQPYTNAPRAGNVYLVRGWGGMFSSGIDDMGDRLKEQNVSAYVYQHNQHQELAKTMAERYKGVPNPEPICMIGHSFGSDDALIIARELDKVNVPVDLIITLDPVNETTVPKNVKLCVNYWMPGIFVGTNFLRGIPLKQEPGGTGKLLNINLNEEGQELKDAFTNHISIDKTPKLRDAIIKRVLETCPDRATWLALHPQQRRVGALPSAGAIDDKARTASGSVGALATPGKTVAPAR